MATKSYYTSTGKDIITKEVADALKNIFGKVEGYKLVFHKDEWDRLYPAVSNGKKELNLYQEWRSEKYVLVLPEQENKKIAYPDAPNRIGVFTKKKLDDWFAVAEEYERLNDEYYVAKAANKAAFLAKRDCYIKKYGRTEVDGKPGVKYDDRWDYEFTLYKGGLVICFHCYDTFIDCHADFYYKLEKNEENIMKIADNAYDMAECNERYDEYMNSFRKKAV